MRAHRERLTDPLRYWLPGLIAGVLAWLAFISLGATPVLRATGLALVIVGMAMMLRRSGSLLAVAGALALAFSPAFWSQTDSTPDLNLGLTLVFLVAGAVVALGLIWRFRERWLLAMIAGFALFAVLFWSELAGLGSLRITTLCAAWLLYLLIDALFRSNPHPDDPPAAAVQARHSYGVLILLAIGVINAPSFIMITPAVIIGLLLYRKRLPWWFWGLLAIILVFGLVNTAGEYVSSTWWTYPAAQAETLGIRVHAIFADGWREASRWVYLVNLVVSQFAILGVGLGILGLSRLARWYPPVGSVTMIAYAAFALFGLVYFGNDAAVLLLPLLMIQIFWMTYAVDALGDWLQRSLNPRRQMLRWGTAAAYLLLPLLMLSRILSSV